MLLHAFVTSHVDYCCSMLFGSPKTVTDKLQCVLNAAANVVTNVHKYDRGLYHAVRHDLHWLKMTDCIQFRIVATVYRCLRGTAPKSRSDLQYHLWQTRDYWCVVEQHLCITHRWKTQLVAYRWSVDDTLFPAVDQILVDNRKFFIHHVDSMP